MRNELLKILACPRCRGDLKIENPIYREDHIWEGNLVCKRCKISFPIKNGVPRLLVTDDRDLRFIARAYGYLFLAYFKRKFEISTLYGITEDEEMQKFFSALEITPQELEGKRILDAGCGVGRLIKNLSRYDAEIIGVDVHTAIEIPFQQSLTQKNVHVIQADLYHLPFSEKFDIIWCEGVLSYTRNPRKGFNRLSSFLKRNGKIYIWISGKSKHSFINYARKFFKYSYRYPPHLIYILSKFLALLYIMGAFLIKRKYLFRKYRYLSFIFYNALLRKYEHHLHISEIKRWFKDEGIKIIKISKHGIGITGIKVSDYNG